MHAPDHSAPSVEDFWPSDRIDIHIDVPAVNYPVKRRRIRRALRPFERG